MTGIDKIVARITADAKEKARTTLEAAQQECQRLAADYNQRAEDIRKEISDRALREGEEIIARARSASAMAHRNILLETKAALLDEAFAAAKAQICDTDYGKYRELLVALLSCALLEQAEQEKQSLELGDEVVPVESYEVLLNANDLPRFGRAVLDGARRVTERRIGSERTAKLFLGTEPAPIDGGLILRCGEIEINCSLSALLVQMRRDLEERISALLFD